MAVQQGWGRYMGNHRIKEWLGLYIKRRKIRIKHKYFSIYNKKTLCSDGSAALFLEPAQKWEWNQMDFPLIWFLWFNTCQVIPTTIPWLFPGLLNILDRKRLVQNVHYSCGCKTEHSCLSIYFHVLGNYLPSCKNWMNLVFCFLVISSSLLFICDWGIKALNGFLILFLYENINTHYNCFLWIHSWMKCWSAIFLM